ncbi:GNAT family N-acetyltransferase [Roseomonas sp. E05]|uniref:GNAT family N-acetyltransferase n=1 Tax=Roseomonas sp. E05 TaxID=3046310 RepID=UPI0024B9C69C|nr:GNAT family N-acetyltransferase [Roseomonas sp. E05]MDJ0387365.1 GNAT family N-acetyltransferase [Roseomonas sp. E05]
MTIRHHADHTEIATLHLEPDCQGRGLDSAVMAALLAERPALPVLLEILKESPALCFYARLGFRPEREQAFGWMLRLPPRA